MNRNEFWELIELIDQEELEKGYYILANSRLISHLEDYELDELKSFQNHLVSLVYDLDGREFMENTGDFKVDPEAFLNFRLYVVAKGKDFYDSVLSDPKKMPKNSMHQNQGLIVVTDAIWYNLHGKEWKFPTEKDYETYSNEKQWK